MILLEGVGEMRVRKNSELDSCMVQCIDNAALGLLKQFGEENGKKIWGIIRPAVLIKAKSANVKNQADIGVLIGEQLAQQFCSLI